MRTATWLIVTTLTACGPTMALAQRTESSSFRRPTWNVSVHGGLTRNGEFVLQRPDAASSERERSLSTHPGFDAGGSLGVDLMPRLGVRTSYTFARSEFQYRDDTGGGSRELDQDNLDELSSHFIAIEILTYMLPADARFTPYGGAGVVGGWYVVEENAQHIQSGAERRLLRTGAIGTLGLQASLAGSLAIRVEAVSANVRNPFAGGDSFRATGGTSLDEPRRASKTDYRIAFVYRFGRETTRTASSSR